jgi:hypothetical protein
MPESLVVIAAVATIVAALVAVTELCWRVWRRVSQKRKRR